MNIKRIISLALCMALAVTLFASALAAFAENPSVTVRVEGIDQAVLYEKDVSYEGGTVLDFLKALLTDKGIEFVADDVYFSSIAGQEAGTFDGWDGWLYYVNGAEPLVGMNEATLKDGDSLLVCYSDPYDAENPTLTPSVKAEGAFAQVVFTFTAQFTTYDADWNPTVSTIPVTGATAVIDGAEYTTDQLGQVSIPRAVLSKASVSVQISKTAENGKPLVIRFAPDFTVDIIFGEISFSDVSAGAWYRDYVVELVRLGAIQGYEDGAFRPNNEVTRAEFIKILACAAPDFDASKVEYAEYFTDVKAGDWYAPYTVWAVDSGLIAKGGAFRPNINLSRQDMALIACLYCEKVLEKQLPAVADAPAFNDDADISVTHKESVYLLQKAGIIQGFGDGMYVPNGSSRRSEVSKIIVMLLNI